MKSHSRDLRFLVLVTSRSRSLRFLISSPLHNSIAPVSLKIFFVWFVNSSRLEPYAVSKEHKKKTHFLERGRCKSETDRERGRTKEHIFRINPQQIGKGKKQTLLPLWSAGAPKTEATTGSGGGAPEGGGPVAAAARRRARKEAAAREDEGSRW